MPPACHSIIKAFTPTAVKAQDYPTTEQILGFSEHTLRCPTAGDRA